MPRRTKGLRQAYDLRDAAAAMVAKCLAAESFTSQLGQQAKAICDGVRAWAEADDHIRIHRGKPLPTQASYAARRKRSNKRGDDGPSPLAPVDSPIDSSATPRSETPSDTAGAADAQG